MNTENSCSAPERFLNYCHATVWTLFISACVIIVCSCGTFILSLFYLFFIVLFCCYRCRNRAKTLVSDVALEIQQRQRFQATVSFRIFFFYKDSSCNQPSEPRVIRRVPQHRFAQHSSFRPTLASENSQHVKIIELIIVSRTLC